jgi:kynurenine formamidase
MRLLVRCAPLPALLAGVWLLARGSPADSPAGGSSKVDLARTRVVDLTHSFDEKTIYWPTSPTTFQLTKLAFGMTEAGYFYAANSFCTPEHGGTHLDAPIHFAKEGRTADQIPVRQLIAPAVVLDVRAKASADPDYRLSLEDVRAFEKTFGPIPEGAIVLLATGWAARWPDRKRYLGDDTPGDASKLHFPSYGREAADHLVRRRRAGALGVDTASIDHGPSKDFAVHRIAAAANVPGLENLASLEGIPPIGAWVVALPMKIAGGSGGPLRIVALVP